jgi:hypothetical protein
VAFALNKMLVEGFRHIPLISSMATTVLDFLKHKGYRVITVQQNI